MLMLQILSLKKASFIASLIRTTVFSCVNIIAKVFSNYQKKCFNEKLGLANTVCHWNTGVMVADNGPLYAYVDIPVYVCVQLKSEVQIHLGWSH